MKEISKAVRDKNSLDEKDLVVIGEALSLYVQQLKNEIVEADAFEARKLRFKCTRAENMLINVRQN